VSTSLPLSSAYAARDQRVDDAGAGELETSVADYKRAV